MNETWEFTEQQAIELLDFVYFYAKTSHGKTFRKRLDAKNRRRTTLIHEEAAPKAA